MRGDLPPRDDVMAPIRVSFYIILCCSHARHTPIHAASCLVPGEELMAGPGRGGWERDGCEDVLLAAWMSGRAVNRIKTAGEVDGLVDQTNWPDKRTDLQIQTGGYKQTD